MKESMQTLAVFALIIGLVMLIRSLGTPVRRSPEERKSSALSPEAEIPPPNPPITMA
jgi:hypothetical protein